MGCTVGLCVNGELVGLTEYGACEGKSVGVAVVGLSVGLNEYGACVGNSVGSSEGLLDGFGVALYVGLAVGCVDGSAVGGSMTVVITSAEHSALG